MCGVRKLTRAAYANQRMTLDRKSAKFQDKAEYEDRATCAITWRVVIIHVLSGHLPLPLSDVVIGNTPLFFSAQGSVVLGSAEKEAKSDSIAGARYLTDTPSGCG